MDRILTRKYDRRTWFIHNLGRYDVSFILKVLIDYNVEMDSEVYKLGYNLRDPLEIFDSLPITENWYNLYLESGS